jgi:hypothetical protein
MHARYNNNIVVAIAGSVALGMGLLMATEAQAAPVSHDVSLAGIPQAGYPSFTFNDDNGGFSKNIQGWFDNMLIVSETDTGYAMDAMNEGDFKLWQSEDTYIQGTDGVFDLHADYDVDGNLLGGDVSIAGILKDLGI